MPSSALVQQSTAREPFVSTEADIGGKLLPALTCLQVIPSLEVLDEEESWYYNTCVASSINKETEEPEVPPGVLQGRGHFFTSSHDG